MHLEIYSPFATGGIKTQNPRLIDERWLVWLFYIIWGLGFQELEDW